MKLARPILLWLTAMLGVAFVFAGACAKSTNVNNGPPDAGPDAGSNLDAGLSGGFIALDRDFAPFKQWNAFVLPLTDAGQKTDYLNALPPHGSTSFPVGTIIVKERIDPTLPGGSELDAMVKRGGGFNPDASGWEFFMLQYDSTMTPYITWRGTGTANPTGYGGSPLSCSQCHSISSSNDYVQSAPLWLTNF
jgi:hypothetical protein